MVGGVPGELHSYSLFNRYVSANGIPDLTVPYLITGIFIEQGIKDPAEKYKSLETFQQLHQRLKKCNRHSLNAVAGIAFVTQYSQLVRQRSVWLGNAKYTGDERHVPKITYYPENTAGETCHLSPLGVSEDKLDSEFDLVVSYENRVVLS